MNNRSINAITKPDLHKCPQRDHTCGSSLLEKADGITLPYLTGGWKTKVWDVVEKEPHPYEIPARLFNAARIAVEGKIKSVQTRQVTRAERLKRRIGVPLSMEPKRPLSRCKLRLGRP